MYIESHLCINKGKKLSMKDYYSESLKIIFDQTHRLRKKTKLAKLDVQTWTFDNPLFYFILFFGLFFSFLGLHPLYIEVPRLGIQSELHHSHGNAGSLPL